MPLFVAFHGYHWHGCIYAHSHPTRDSRWGRKLTDFSKSHPEVYFTCEKVFNKKAYVSHIIKPPRVIINVKGDEYSEEIQSAQVEITMDLWLKDIDFEEKLPEEDIEWEEAGLKQDITYKRIIVLKKLMLKYATHDSNELRKKIKKNKKDDERFVELFCLQNFKTIHDKATEMYTAEECHIPLKVRMTTCPTFDGETEKWLSLNDSTKFMNKWFEFNRIIEKDFLQDLFNVLEKKIKKKNTFVLKGLPNSGKSWLLRSLLFYYPFYGEVHGTGSYNFAYMGCINKPLIFIEEPLFEMSNVEHAKNILEGAPTQINVKCKAPQILQPTPVLITTNHDIWRHCRQEEDALRSRSYIYEVSTYNELKDIDKSVHPSWWKTAYNTYKMDLETAANTDAIAKILTYNSDSDKENIEPTTYIIKEVSEEAFNDTVEEWFGEATAKKRKLARADTVDLQCYEEKIVSEGEFDAEEERKQANIIELSD